MKTPTMQLNLFSVEDRAQLGRRAAEQNWGIALLLTGWLHLFAFLLCYYLTIVVDCHDAPPYLLIWICELCGMGLIFRWCGRARPGDLPAQPLEKLIARVWIAYFILAFNLGSMNTLRGHRLFELFPATASLASFAFLMMTVLIDGRFFGAVLVMFAAGLLMAAHLWHAFLVFAVAWWLVLNVIGAILWRMQRHDRPAPTTPLRVPSSHAGPPSAGRREADVVPS